MAHFRQLYDSRSQSYAYLIADADRREAVIVDPVAGQANLYLALLDELQLRLTHVLLTHVHGRVAQGADELRLSTPALLVAGPLCGLAHVDVTADGVIAFGNEVMRCRATPGHTAGCVSYLWRDRVFTGDALLIGDCGANSADGGDVGALFDSITRKLLTLPDETLIYPAHDGAGRRVSCIGEQREANPKLAGTTRDEFIAKHSCNHRQPQLQA